MLVHTDAPNGCHCGYLDEVGFQKKLAYLAAFLQDLRMVVVLIKRFDYPVFFEEFREFFGSQLVCVKFVNSYLSLVCFF